MTPETIQKIKEIMAPVAEKIGQGAEFGWVTVLRQQYTYAWLAVFFVIIGVVVLVVSNIVGIKIFKRHTQYSDARFGAGVLIVLGSVSGCVSIVLGSIVAITHFLNPAFYALDFFIGLAK